MHADSHSPNPEAPASGRLLAMGMILLHVGALGVFLSIIWPLMSLIMERQGQDAWLIGVMSAMTPLSVIGTMLLAGRLLAGGKPVPLMLAGLFVGLVVVILIGLFQRIELWIALRFVMGVGIALPWLLGETLINAFAPDDKRGRIVSLYTVTLFLGLAIGPLLLERIGTFGLAPFWWAVVALIVAAVPLLVIRSVSVDVRPPQGTRLLTLIGKSPLLMCAGLLAGLSELTVYAIAPLFILRTGLGPDMAVVILSVFIFGGLALQPFVGLAADRFDRRVLLTTIGWLTAGIAAALFFTLGRAFATQVVFFLLGGTALAFYTIGLVLLGQRFKGGELALANAGFILMYQLGSIAGPTVAGGALDLIGPLGFIVVIGLSGALFGLLGIGRLSAAGRA